MTPPAFLIVLSTCPDTATAGRIGRTLVEEGLAACVNIAQGLRSIYTWRGAIQDEEEVLLLIKTTAARFEALRQRILELHPYDVPEVVALELANGHDAYLRWIEMATRATLPPGLNK